MATRRSIRGTVRQRGFTLIEVMVVIVILGLISAAVAVNVIRYKKDADVRIARMEMKELANALELYRLKRGKLPDSLDALYQEHLIKKAPIDPWRAPYQLEKAQNADGFRITSLGADGASGGEGDAADLHSDDPDEAQ